MDAVVTFQNAKEFSEGYEQGYNQALNVDVFAEGYTKGYNESNQANKEAIENANRVNKEAVENAKKVIFEKKEECWKLKGQVELLLLMHLGNEKAQEVYVGLRL